ncbi:hypothetical protein BDP55DRAFT_638961 [Colletotrichum godetiae]|uniref:Uncharacterized protein n=1 Tax=Colletotrichum godetiae TaxID=1209918 RepID=A0AAJ0EQ88_9PEZI|nr:uncharacterized protein BDP55DRAFT_638961 [Colletotrichum godetiae]KAK1657213.1 hypothetical protein BDP55DRAFT_638961 [Colletotrichum godetiae]
MPFLSKPTLACPASPESHQPSKHRHDRDSRPRYHVDMDQQHSPARVRSFAPSPRSNLMRQQRELPSMVTAGDVHLWLFVSPFLCALGLPLVDSIGAIDFIVLFRWATLANTAKYSVWSA